ncbi:hypothetical protein O9929_13520 [Vibrio lentus]|nr:hypothetical protein [Vibrio lentus]
MIIIAPSKVTTGDQVMSSPFFDLQTRQNKCCRAITAVEDPQQVHRTPSPRTTRSLSLVKMVLSLAHKAHP